MVKLGRNEKCPCGSGKKYKKCCINIFNTNNLSYAKLGNVMQGGTNKRKIKLKEYGLYIDFCKPIIFQDKKFWALGSQMNFTPNKEETFHEFIIRFLIHSLGKPFYDQECNKVLNKKHHIYKCISKYEEWRKSQRISENSVGGDRYGAFANGWVQELICLAFDYAIIFHKSHIPQFFNKKLINRKSYQSARYELLIASLFARMGYKVDFKDESTRQDYNYDFDIFDLSNKLIARVEAKSKPREGTIHTKGKLNILELSKGDIKSLYQKALSQNPNDSPYIIFIDVNSPRYSIENTLNEPWFADFIDRIKDVPTYSINNLDPCSLLVITNYSYHYYESNVAIGGGHVLSLPEFPKYRLIPDLIDKLDNVLNTYGKVPNLDLEFD